MESKMKKILLVAFAVLVSVSMSAQLRITTKKMKIDDFTSKTTKVVLSGNDYTDDILRDNVMDRWTISPFEFCTLDEFNSLKKSSDYYFLMVVNSRFRKETQPGISMLTLVKGGSDNLNDMLEVVSVPFCSVQYPSGREIVFTAALLDIIQNFVTKAMKTDIQGYTGLSNYSLNLPKLATKQIYYSKGDLSPTVGKAARELYFDHDTFVCEEDAADSVFTNNTYNAAVSYCVYPTDPQKGSYSYQLLIDAQTHELYYFTKHRITPRLGTGFLVDDVKRISNSSRMSLR